MAANVLSRSHVGAKVRVRLPHPTRPGSFALGAQLIQQVRLNLEKDGVRLTVVSSQRPDKDLLANAGSTTL
jgi:hypothetical protein